ncbi:hypothetical protein ACFPN2_21955 [Steroidobacter flavus]|uniref:Fenitrothion hydrolase FedB n=1 Tax=Steroidobacter flavus TaxID=1842136 RepID=A0ABV8SVW4_9GAMM
MTPRRLRHWIVLACLVPTLASAHSFGAVYVLPVPFWMYVYSCVATLLITFSLLGFLVTAPPVRVQVAHQHLKQSRREVVLSPLMLSLMRAVAMGCLLLTLVAGWFDSDDAGRNIAMTLFWVMFLLGFAYITLVAGDLYALINPWRTAIDGLERLGCDLARRRLRWPRRLGYWPAVVGYVALVAIELFVKPTPRATAILLLIYSAITLLGCFAFGATKWFRRADFFSVYFRLIGTLAPVEYRRLRGAPVRWRVRLRSPFASVLRQAPSHIALVLFVLFMLSSTTYDAILDTVLWVGLFWKNALWLFEPLWGEDLGKAQTVLMDWYLLYRQAGLLIFPFLYLGLYLLVLYLAKLVTRSVIPLNTLVLKFCYSLLPIAIAYHFSHYFTFLWMQVKALPLLFSDPLGLGWHLLPLQGGVPAEPSTLEMGVVWHTQVAVLLGGHVASIYLAHVIAMRTFANRRPVLSQLPTLVLMVAYTIVGLWILSLPLGAEQG